MSCVWIWLSLFCALQTSVSSDEMVSLNCSSPHYVTVGKNVTLNCYINSKGGSDCRALNYSWMNQNHTKLCGLPEYRCKWDPPNSLSLTILSVQREENVTAAVMLACGMDQFSISIHLQSGPAPTPGQLIRPEESKHVTTIVLCVFASTVAVLILYFLYRTYRRRVSDRTGTYTTPVSKDFTAV